VSLNVVMIAAFLAWLLASCGKGDEPFVRAPYPQPTPGSELVTYTLDVGPVFQSNCAGGGCHGTTPFPYLEAKAKLKAAGGILERVKLPESDARHMPRGGRSLSGNVILVLEKWAADGYLLDTEPPVTQRPAPPRVTGDEINVRVVSDLLTLPRAEQTDVRYLTFQSLPDLKQAQLLAKKAINSLSSARTLIDGGPGGGRATDFYLRFNLSHIGLLAQDWDRIALAASAESPAYDTEAGLQAQRLTGTRFPWLRADLFARVALTDPVYREIHPTIKLALGTNGGRDSGTLQPRLPLTATSDAARLKALLGLNEAAEFASLRPHLTGFQGAASGVALHNRLAVLQDLRTVSSKLAETADFDAGDTVKNLSQFPVKADFGGQTSFVQAGGEIIFPQANGLHGYLVFNAVGRAIDAVPTNVATHRLDLRDPSVNNGVDCFSCHSVGLLLPPSNTVLRGLRENANAGVNAADRNLGLALYRDDSVIRQDIALAQQEYAAAVKLLGGDSLGSEPISEAVERYENQRVLGDVAAWELGIPRACLEACIAQDVVLQAQLSGLLDGTGVDRDSFRAQFAKLNVACRLGAEPLIPGGCP